MQRPVDHQHRPRLCGIAAVRRCRRKSPAFDHPRPALLDAEHPVGQQTEIPRPVSGYDTHLLLAVFDIEPYRSPVIMEHASIHSESQPLTGRKTALHPREIAKDGAGPVAQEQPQVLLRQVHFADGEIGAVEQILSALGRQGRRGRQHHQ